MNVTLTLHLDATILFLGIYAPLKRKGGIYVSIKDTYTNVESSFIHNSQKLKTIQMYDEWMNNPWFIHTVKYYSAIKRKNLLISKTAWINNKLIMLRERSQAQKKNIQN